MDASSAAGSTDVYGSATRPASPAQVKAKFRANAALCLDAAAIAGLEDAVDTLADHATARLGVHLLSAARRRLLRSTIMMHFDLVLAGGDILLPGIAPLAADLAILAGKFAAILAPGSAVSARERLEISGLTVFPGVVDAHLHLGHGKDISRPRVADDAAQETAAAAAGGITTFIPYLMATRAVRSASSRT